MSPRNHKLHDAIGFALNYPTEWEIVRHDVIKKKYRVRYLQNGRYPQGGWYEIDLDEKLVRSCRTHTGPKAWVAPPTTRYEDIFKKEN